MRQPWFCSKTRVAAPLMVEVVGVMVTVPEFLFITSQNQPEKNFDAVEA